MVRIEICAEGQAIQAGRISNRTGVHLACRMYELDPFHSATRHGIGRSDSKRDQDPCLADAIFHAKPNLEDLRAFHFKFQFSPVPFRIGPDHQSSRRGKKDDNTIVVYRTYVDDIRHICKRSGERGSVGFQTGPPVHDMCRKKRWSGGEATVCRSDRSIVDQDSSRSYLKNLRASGRRAWIHDQPMSPPRHPTLFSAKSNLENLRGTVPRPGR